VPAKLDNKIPLAFRYEMPLPVPVVLIAAPPAVNEMLNVVPVEAIA
jgi:hypothetical protein